MSNNIEVNKAVTQSKESNTLCLYPHTPNKVAPNNTRELDPLSQPSLPDVILYKANILGDPSLWDGNFGVISLSGINKFLWNDVNNMTTSLLHMATFLNQRKLDD